MSFTNRSLETPAERAVRLWVASVSGASRIDPLFERRLRGVVLNRYVAAREAPAALAPERRRMGVIGRAALYASLALSMSVGSVMAASNAALPGELLYPIKRQIEEVRASVLPPGFRDDLAAHAFAQRVHELGRLVEEGQTARATALLPDVGATYERLLALRPEAGAAGDLVEAQLAVLQSLLERLPPQAAAAIERALDHAPGLNRAAPGQDPGRGGPGGGGRPDSPGPKGEPRAPNGNGNGNGNGGGAGPGGAEPSSGPKPDREPRKSPAAAPSPTAAPDDAPTPPDPDDEDD